MEKRRKKPKAKGYSQDKEAIKMLISPVSKGPPSQDDDVEELFFEEQREASNSTPLVLMGDFNLPESNWAHHTAGATWARRFLKNLHDHFTLRDPTQKDVLLDLLLIKRGSCDRPRSLRTLSWSTMTVRTINSKSALKLWGICYSNWIPAKLWGLMGSQNLSWQVLNDFGNPERSQLTGSWRLLSLF
ncbi:hypothetical protein TURU_141181 [Turdus rufiventris]|nr:hypothetical protein TURU_141181 [Turdus rufiventris]